MTHYTYGTALEYDVIADLRSWQYKIIRSAGSHGPIDVLAAKCVRVGDVEFRRKLAIQCKRGLKAKFTDEDKERLFQWAEAFDAVPVLVEKKGRETKWKIFRPAEELKGDFLLINVDAERSGNAQN